MAPASLKRPKVCTHIKAAGQRCGSPALRGEFFCYFHTRIIKGVQQRVDMRLHSMALLEDCESIQLSLMHVVDGLVKGTLDPTRAKLIIQALRIAARNAKDIRFDDNLYQPSDPPMVREVPDYARQYQIENPAGPSSADTPVREAEANAGLCGADTLVREAKPTRVARTLLSASPGQTTATNREPAAQAEPAPQTVSMENAKSAATEPAAKRRKNAAHSASCGSEPKNNPAPKERKKPSESHKNPQSPNHSKEHERIQQAEAAIADALQGNWRTVFDFAGISLPNHEPPS
jgi:hypothetical protein